MTWFDCNLETALAAPGNNDNQNKVGHKFVADNTGEATPFDWYNARFSVDFKVNQLAAGADIDADGDQMGIVNGSSSLIKRLSYLTLLPRDILVSNSFFLFLLKMP